MTPQHILDTFISQTQQTVQLAEVAVVPDWVIKKYCQHMSNRKGALYPSTEELQGIFGTWLSTVFGSTPVSAKLKQEWEPYREAIKQLPPTIRYSVHLQIKLQTRAAYMTVISSIVTRIEEMLNARYRSTNEDNRPQQD